ncbi:MAG: hypothetical protein AABW45_01125 [Nanoarchaeota archaeon]
MPFIGFNFDKIIAERKKDQLKGDLKVEHNLNIKDLVEDEVNLDKTQNVLKFKFEFTLNYEPGYASVKIEGHLLYLESPKKIKEIMQVWKKDKKIQPDIMQGLFNTILTKSNIKALELSQDLNLPPHIPMPKLTRQQPKNVKEYIG